MSHACTGSLVQWPRWPRLGTAGARKEESLPSLSHDGRGPDARAMFSWFPKHVSRTPGGKLHSLDSTSALKRDANIASSYPSWCVPVAPLVLVHESSILSYLVLCEFFFFLHFNISL